MLAQVGIRCSRLAKPGQHQQLLLMAAASPRPPTAGRPRRGRRYHRRCLRGRPARPGGAVGGRADHACGGYDFDTLVLWAEEPEQLSRFAEEIIPAVLAPGGQGTRRRLTLLRHRGGPPFWSASLRAPPAVPRGCSGDLHWRRGQLVVSRKGIAEIEEGGDGLETDLPDGTISLGDRVGKREPGRVATGGPHRHRLGERAHLLEAPWDALEQVDLDRLRVAGVPHVHIARNG